MAYSDKLAFRAALAALWNFAWSEWHSETRIRRRSTSWRSVRRRDVAIPAVRFAPQKLPPPAPTGTAAKGQNATCAMQTNFSYSITSSAVASNSAARQGPTLAAAMPLSNDGLPDALMRQA
jgi:hypothetical protein